MEVVARPKTVANGPWQPVKNGAHKFFSRKGWDFKADSPKVSLFDFWILGMRGRAILQGIRRQSAEALTTDGRKNGEVRMQNEEVKGSKNFYRQDTKTQSV